MIMKSHHDCFMPCDCGYECDRHACVQQSRNIRHSKAVQAECSDPLDSVRLAVNLSVPRPGHALWCSRARWPQTLGMLKVPLVAKLSPKVTNLLMAWRKGIASMLSRIPVKRTQLGKECCHSLVSPLPESWLMQLFNKERRWSVATLPFDNLLENPHRRWLKVRDGKVGLMAFL